MPYAVNPIRLLTDNLKGYADALHAERIKLWQRDQEIDAEMTQLGKLGVAMGIDIGTTVQFAHDNDLTYDVAYGV